MSIIRCADRAQSKAAVLEFATVWRSDVSRHRQTLWRVVVSTVICTCTWVYVAVACCVQPGEGSGTTAVMALLRGGRHLFVANVGDSRAVLSRRGTALDLSYDHKPEDPIELARIAGAGGRVTPDGRVNGGLNLSRAFGTRRSPTHECTHYSRSVPFFLLSYTPYRFS